MNLGSFGLRRSPGLWCPCISPTTRSEARSPLIRVGCWVPDKGGLRHSGTWRCRRTWRAGKRTPSRGFTDRCRSSALGARWFRIEAYPRFGRVAQLVRAPASHAGGHRFESCRAHHELSVPSNVIVLPPDWNSASTRGCRSSFDPRIFRCKFGPSEHCRGTTYSARTGSIGVSELSPPRSAAERTPGRPPEPLQALTPVGLSWNVPRAGWIGRSVPVGGRAGAGRSIGGWIGRNEPAR